ncbi:MAG: T9SS type A sorting domain-containing protein [Flavobacterium sp.]|nr:T9SS type A sorting domain-containing protein [Flavobacterium sp.]
MKKILLSSVFLLATFFTNAQATFNWSLAATAFNSNGLLCHSIATDSQGNVYQTGKDANGTSNMYLSKRNSAGVSLWFKQMTAISFTFSYSAEAYTIAIDASDNLYISGNVTNGGAASINVDFDPGAAVFSMAIPATKKVTFISKLTSDGNLIWAKQFNSTATIYENNDDVVCMKIDASGNLYATGGFGSTVDFDPGAGVYNLTSVGIINARPKQNIFVLKLNSSGNLVWAKSFLNQTPVNDTSYPDQGTSIDVDNAGNVYTTGYFSGGIDADPGVGTHLLVKFNSNLISDTNTLFISKLDSNGNYVWANTIAGNHAQAILNIPTIKLDNAENLILQTNSQINASTLIDYDFGPGTQYLSVGNYTGDTCPVVLKMDANANFIWVKILALTQSFYTNASCNQTTLDAAGNIYSIGSFACGYNSSANTYGTMDFDPSAASFNMTSNGVTDIFLTKLDNNGNFLWANQIGGSGYENAKSFAVSQSGNIIILGESGAGFNKSATSTSAGIFMASYSQPGLSNSQFELDKNISVYPNPTTNEFNIKISENLMGAKATIYNILGQKIKDFTLNSLTTNQNLDKGMYLIAIEKEGNSST